MAVAVGQRCVVRIKITDVELRQASDIMATIVSPQGEEKCQDISFDEVSGLVYVAVVFNSVGNWSMWLNVRFANEVLYTPVFVFAEVDGEAEPCDVPYIVDVEVQGESVSVTPPKVDVDAVGREEFDALAKQVTINTEAIANLGDNTIIVDYDRIAELKASEEGDDVTHPEIAELVEKIYNEQDKLILIRHFADTREQLDPTYFVPDTNYGSDEFGNVIITLFASYTPTYNTYGEQSLHNLEISITQAGAILRVKQERVTLLNNESVIDKLNIADSKKPLSANQGRMLDRMKVGYAEYDSEKKAILLFSDNTKKYQLGEIPIDSLAEEGYYPKMTVGMSDNLVGRGDVQDAQINFRPSAGADNITDGAARIERIKGNSVVWNQLATKSNVSIEQNNSANESAQSFNIYDCAEYLVKDRWYYIDVVKNNVSGVEIIRYGNISSSDTSVLISGKVVQCITNSFKPSISYTVGANTTSTGTITPIIIDLTQMFGAGNEPTSYEEYLQRKPMNIEDEFAYNEGELIDMKVDSLISTSDNAYDYTKEYARVMGGHTYDCSYGTAFVEKVYFSTNKDNIVAEENAMTSENGKYVFPSDGYAVPYTTDGDVREYCVCLQHTYTKPHPPYQQDVKDLSFIGEAFPEGMRSAGSAYDEIRYNATTKKWEKVTRIGAIDLGSLTYSSFSNNAYHALIVNSKRFFWGVTTSYIQRTTPISTLSDKEWTSNSVAGYSIWIKDSNYTTAAEFKASLNGVMLYYELAEPIVTEIEGSENWNLDYLVWDFGTEEAIASVPSAPFRADINYEPNAVDDLRWAIDEIRKLKAQLAQMQASVTNLTE